MPSTRHPSTHKEPSEGRATSVRGRQPGAPTEDDFEHWWNTQGSWVEPPNQRRGGESGVQRLCRDGQTLFCKRQTGHLYRSWRRPFGEPTVLREAAALRALQRLHVGVPNLVFAGARRVAGQWRALLVSQSLDGFSSLSDWYARDPESGETGKWRDLAQERLLEALGQTLARLHDGGWQHGCLYPKHIFLRVEAGADSPRVTVVLLDLEKSRRRSPEAAARHDLRQLDRHHHAMPDAHWQALMKYYQAHRLLLASSGRGSARVAEFPGASVATRLPGRDHPA